jgi:hypothetical protein
MASAIFGLAGVVVGGLLQLLAQYLTSQGQRRVDRKRKEILRSMLNHPDYKWRSLDQCKKVIGADDATTQRLLIEINARASETNANSWGLMSRNPFSSVPDD